MNRLFFVFFLQFAISPCIGCCVFPIIYLFLTLFVYCIAGSASCMAGQGIFQFFGARSNADRTYSNFQVSEAPSRTVSSLLGVSNEGIQDSDVLLVQRTALYELCFQKLAMSNVVLLRAPPYSGKTSFGNLFARFCRGKGFCALYFTCLGMSNTSLEDLFRAQFGEGNSLFSLLREQEDFHNGTVVLIVDEVQMTYKITREDCAAFWENVKRLYGNELGNLKVLLLGAYGGDSNVLSSSTPICIAHEHTLSHDQLAFSLNEVIELIELFNGLQSPNHNMTIANLVPISNDMATRLFHLTGGHVGLCRYILIMIASYFLSTATYSSGFPVTENAFVGYLLGSDMFEKLKNTRCVSFDWRDSEAMRKIIHDVMINGHATILDSDTSKLVKSGVLAISSYGACEFSSPLLECIARDVFYPKPSSGTVKWSFEEFVKFAVLNMDHSLLSQSMSVGANDLIYEAQLQSEFYRSVYSLLPASDKIFPNVGYMFGSKGYLDFYVNGDKQWGIELSRNSSLLDKHIERFLNNGIYSCIPFKRWIVINFVQVETIPDFNSFCGTTTISEYELRVVYSQSNQRVLILRCVNNQLQHQICEFSAGRV